ncbi:MAG: methylenetetrahydrofolate reductase [NAD(P)H] [bacterium]
MKVCDSLKKGSPTLSFEFFPPKTAEQEAHLFEVLAKLKDFKPDFASVTCGALGSNVDKTLFWVKEIKEKFRIEPVAHLTCVAATRESMKKQLDELEAAGVNNVLALRGDPPQGEEEFVPPANGFAHACELVAFIKEQKPDFCVGVAGYPEGHPETESLTKDIECLKLKIDVGADYVITQLFFDNKFFFDFIGRCKQQGISIPIIPGVMAITGVKQIKKLTQMCGAAIPQDLLQKLEAADGDKEGVKKIGVEQAIAQCQGLIKAKVSGLHFFVMNQSGPISAILGQLEM